MRQKTVASLLSQSSSQIVPQALLYKTSALPRVPEPTILTFAKVRAGEKTHEVELRKHQEVVYRR